MRSANGLPPSQIQLTLRPAGQFVKLPHDAAQGHRFIRVDASLNFEFHDQLTIR